MEATRAMVKRERPINVEEIIQASENNIDSGGVATLIGGWGIRRPSVGSIKNMTNGIKRGQKEKERKANAKANIRIRITAVLTMATFVGFLWRVRVLRRVWMSTGS